MRRGLASAGELNSHLVVLMIESDNGNVDQFSDILNRQGNLSHGMGAGGVGRSRDFLVGFGGPDG